VSSSISFSWSQYPLEQIWPLHSTLRLDNVAPLGKDTALLWIHGIVTNHTISTTLTVQLPPCFIILNKNNEFNERWQVMPRTGKQTPNMGINTWPPTNSTLQKRLTVGDVHHTLTTFLFATLSWENRSYKQACFAKWDYFCYRVLTTKDKCKLVTAFFQLQMKKHIKLKHMYDYKRSNRNEIKKRNAQALRWTCSLKFPPFTFPSLLT
jgi:hypothetical protein